MFWYNLFKFLFGQDNADKLTNYQYWSIPPAENVEPPRIKDIVIEGDQIPWGVLNELYIDFRTKVHSDGRLSGRPMQVGTSDMRTISWGYLEWGQKFKTLYPKAKSGFYWVTGYPVPNFDKHNIISEPHESKKIFHETIQLNPDLDPDFIVGNNALGWGKWEDGKLVEGRASTATDLPAHPYVWTPWSKENPHRVSIVVDDYVGADGTLKKGEGVEAGAVVVLKRNSDTYNKMKALGGECAAIAEAAALYGAVVIDRQIDSQNRVDKPTMAIQPGSQWKNTNIDKLNMKLGDFVYAK